MTFIESREKARKTISDAVQKAIDEFRDETGLCICEVKVALISRESRVDMGLRIVDSTFLQNVTLVTNADDPVPW